MSTQSTFTLEKPAQYFDWLDHIQRSIAPDLWKFFTPDDGEEYEVPNPVLFSDIHAGAQRLSDLTAAEKTTWQQLASLHNTSVNHYHRFLKESSRLCQTIENSVPKAYMPKSRNEQGNNPRWLLQQIKASMMQDPIQMRNETFARYRTIDRIHYNRSFSVLPIQYVIFFMLQNLHITV